MSPLQPIYPPFLSQTPLVGAFPHLLNNLGEAIATAQTHLVVVGAAIPLLDQVFD